MPYRFMFATGIENSNPTIQNGKHRVDEFEKCKHYDQWAKDFDLVQELGISFLRYGVPLHRVYLQADEYDWSFSDLVYNDLRKRKILPIVDLCHFGVPDWIGNFQNPDFPKLFASYASSFAKRYPWIQLYTPINEMYICALFSAYYGWWNEQLTTDLSFATALKYIVKANVMAMQEILKVRPDAIFIQSESTEYFHAKNPKAIKPAELMNARRFLSLDLNYGKRIDSDMYEYLMDNGLTRDEYHFFLSHNLKRHCIMGNDYYINNEHRVSPSGRTRSAGEVLGYYVITSQYYERYRIPIMHTETNIPQGHTGKEAIKWLLKEWANVMRIRNDGIPILGFTWYSLIDQVDWNSALRENEGKSNSAGLYDLDRNIRPVGKAYKQLIKDWKDVLPTQSGCLIAPIKYEEMKDISAEQNRGDDAERNMRSTPKLFNADKEPLKKNK